MGYYAIKKERKEKMENSGGNIKTVYKLKKRNFLITSLLVLGVFMITLGGLFSTKSLVSDVYVVGFVAVPPFNS